MTNLIRLLSPLLLATIMADQVFSASHTDIVNTAQNNLLALDAIADGKRINGISTQCQTALRGDEASPDCADDVEDDITDDDFDEMCTRPANGRDGHRCSSQQVTKALDALERDCAKELNDKHGDIIAYYSYWQTYELNYQIVCSTSSSGEYCIREARKNNTVDDKCINDQLNYIKNWKPPREEKYVTDSAAALREAAKPAAQEKNIDISLNSTNSSSENQTTDESSNSSASSIQTMIPATIAIIVASLVLV
jgi:hypothetical protein